MSLLYCQEPESLHPSHNQNLPARLLMSTNQLVVAFLFFFSFRDRKMKSLELRQSVDLEFPVRTA